MSTSDLVSLVSLPGSEAIGHMYDVFGKYAHPESVGARIFNFAHEEVRTVDDRDWLLSTDIKYNPIRDFTSKTISSTRKDSFSEELARSAGISVKYGAFSSQVESDYKESSLRASDRTYISHRAEVRKWKLSFKDTSLDSLRKKLDPTFERELQNSDPIDLFGKYGVYFLYEVMVGGRANCVAVTQTSTFDNENEIKHAAELSFSSLTGSVGTNITGEEKKLVTKFRSNSQTSLHILGGKQTGSLMDPEKYQAWLDSLDTLPVFSNFSHGSLRPIWELLPMDPAGKNRSVVLKQAAKHYVPSYVKITAIVSLEVVSSDYSDVEAPAGYEKIGYDLNKGARGKFIYLCYKTAKVSISSTQPGDHDTPNPIQHIQVAYGDDPNVGIPKGYNIIRKDLNEGARGKYIYILYTTDASQIPDGEGLLPIRGLRVVGAQERNDIEVPTGFRKIDVDLNMGAGGEFVYLCYSRQLYSNN